MRDERLLIVGIGASAGGLRAMIELLEVASCHKAMCFVVVSHVSRFQDNDLPRILGRVSKLESMKIIEGLGLEPCKLYTISPNTHVRLRHGRFQVTRRPADVPNRSADVFFESLSQCCAKNAIGVVLSGAGVGEDGAAGLAAIKKAGGHTYAQDPNEAQFADMPSAAIRAGAVDSVLPAAVIGHELSLLSWVEAHEGVKFDG